MEIKVTCVSKNFDETVRLQSEKREEWIREIKRERLQGILEGKNSALRLASLSAAPFPGKNERPGTHCSLVEQEEREDRFSREFQVKGKMEEKTERESDRRIEEKCQT